MVTIAAPLLFAIVGALAYGYSKNAKIVRIGEISLFVGLLWLVYLLSNTHLHL